MSFSEMTDAWWELARDNSLNAAARRLILEYKVSACSITCMKSDCWGYHSSKEKRRCPLNMSTGKLAYQAKMCTRLPNCPYSDACNLAHSESELCYHPYRYKTLSCLGDCTLGNLCSFSHNPTDLRDNRLQQPSSHLPLDSTWSDSDKLFFIIAWVILIDSNSLDLEKAKSIHATLITLVDPEILFIDGGGYALAQVLQANASSQVSTASSTIDQ